MGCHAMTISFGRLTSPCYLQAPTTHTTSYFPMLLIRRGLLDLLVEMMLSEFLVSHAVFTRSSSSLGYGGGSIRFLAGSALDRFLGNLFYFRLS